MPQSSVFLLQPVSAAEAGQKLLQFLTRRFTQAHGELPPSMIHRWIRTGQIRCNGKRCKAFQHVLEGDTIRLPPFAVPMLTKLSPPQPEASLRASRPAPDASHSRQQQDGPQQYAPSTPHDAPYAPPSSQATAFSRSALACLPSLPRIIYETDHIVVCNKISGLPVHGGTGHSDSLTTRLQAHYVGAPFSPTPAHRLDKETSGLLLVARSYGMLRFLQQAFADHRMGKEYLAWVDGLWPLESPPQELCDTLGKHYTGDYAKVECRPPASAKSATQDAAPANADPANAAPTSTTDSSTARAIMQCVEHRGQHSLMHIRLLTGKTHQIRVQLASRGFPLCGDVKYGSAGRPPFKLHAMRLIVPPQGEPENTPLYFECLPPWQGAWRVRCLPPPLPAHGASTV